MPSSLTHHSPTRKSIEVTVPASEVAEEYGKVIAKIAPKVRVPGFRPGKAPKDVLMKRYEREILGEVAENLVNRHFMTAASAEGVFPISRPAIEKFDLKEGEQGSFRAHFDVAPTVELPDYKNLTITKRKRAIDDEAVEEHLESLRQQNAKFIPVEDAPAAPGHYATLDIKVKPQGMKAMTYTDQVIQLAEGRPFDQEILGMKAEETKTFSITIPADDPNRAMAGKAVAYEATLKDLRSRQISELGDDFAKDLGTAETLADLKVAVRKDLEEAAERDAVTRLQSAVLDALLDAAPFEVPASMVSLQLDDYCQEFAEMAARQGVDPKNINWNAYRTSRKLDAERAVRSGYLLQAIGNAEDLQVSDEEIDAEIRSIMEEHKINQPFEAFKASLEKRGATTEIKGRVRTDKIFDLILKTATIQEELLDKAAFAAQVEMERRREAGIPQARYDAGGLEGGELEAQEGGDPAAVKAAEHVHGPDCDHDH
ncbi:MAG TPA: trigger factor [Holophaga sp.]|nr:trigger factor [Holophaga sp.]